MNTPADPPAERSDAFDRAWALLAARGLCDEIDGAEYRRLHASWHRLVGLAYALDYITQAANRPVMAAPKDGGVG